MNKLIGLELNKFPSTPNSLRSEPSVDAPKTDINVDLANLFHHYYLDTHGKAPPNPDPATFEHLQYLAPDPHFRVRGEGLGPSTSARRNRSSEFGHAFCRWFLHDHLNITYFAHMEHVLNRALSPAFAKLKVERIAAGDAPDYFCAESVNNIFLAEAKGRHESIGFGNKEFSKWRQQFDRVVVKDQGGKPRSVKGYIVATRFATEAHPNVNSTIYAEDPESPGDHGLGPDDAPNLGRIVIDGHYSDIAGKLNQPILAAALGSGFRVPNEIQFQVVVWELLIGPNAGRRFVGGYYLPGGGSAPLREENKRLRVGISDPLRLDATWGAFFGVEETIFRQVVGMARGDDDALPRQLERFEQVQPFYSGASILRDGSIIAPVDFFAVVGQVTL